MRGWFALLLCLLPLQALADAAADKDFLTTWLEENLSGAGRFVTIDGFQGALSSQASLQRLTIADDQGVWLTLKDVRLDWSQTALLSGKIAISELSAAEIDLDRMPATAATSGVPAAQASALALPDLPVSIAIDGIAAQKIVLGPTILGQAVEGSLAADLSLAGGEGAAHLNLQRLGSGPQGHVTLAVSFSNTTQVLGLSLDAAEDAGGIAASLLHVPGAPATSLVLDGTGPLSNFAATVNLSTDGQTRLAGTLTQTDDAEGNRSFAADLAGDPTPVFLPDYASFFGPDVKLQAKGQRAADGVLRLDTLSVQAQALSLTGRMVLGADGQPEALNFTGTLGLPEGPVTLPMATAEPVKLGHADLTLVYDKARSPLWNFATTITQFDSGSLGAGLLRVTAVGRLQDSLFDGTARFSALSLAPRDKGLAQALGATVTGAADFRWNSATSGLEVSNLALTAPGYALQTEGTIGQMADLQGHASGHYDDLTRLAALAGKPLKGAVRFDLDGQASPVSGAFDLTGTLLGSGLGLGISQVDGVLAAGSQLKFSARRDAAGTVVRSLSVQAASLAADLSGSFASDGGNLSGTLGVGDLSALGPGYHGSLTAKVSFQGTLAAGQITAQAQGQDLAIGQRQVDSLLRGKSTVTATLALTPDGVRIDQAQLGNPQFTASATGAVSGTSRDLTLSAKLANLGLLYPQFPGAVTVSGTATQGNDGTKLDLAAVGPGQIDAKVRGILSSDYARANLSLSGTATAALANALIAPRSIDGAVRFDLRLNGPLAISSLAGPVSIAGGRLADPSQTFGLTDLAATAQLGGGRVQITATSGVTTGGKIAVQGSVGLGAPYSADLTIKVEQAVLKDPQLYATTANGTLTFRGPALGGASVAGSVALGRTELRIPSTGMEADGGLPGLKHVNEPAVVRATRTRAGVDSAKAASGAGAGYNLDVTISAPNQVFIRGRGLDAELGGNLVLRGSTANISPSGAFNLIRGRLDILGRRLILSEAQVQLQGALVPYVHVLASVESDGVTSSVQIDGAATDPSVTFTSSPDLPQEEVLARLLFNHGLENISAFQAAQLASAVATLAGRGGEGVLGALRRKTGLDNLDVQADGTGNTSVTAGKYFGDKTYSEVTVDQAGKSSISLNYDVTRHITLKGHADSDGTTGVGIYLKRDY